MSLQSFQSQPQAVDGAPESQIKSSDLVAGAFVVGDTVDPLLDWSTSTSELAMWKRSLPTNIEEAIDHLRLASIRDWRLTTNPQALETDVHKAMSTCGLEREKLRRFFASDMVYLCRAFAAGTGYQKLEVRFEVVKNDACSRFHTDSYGERLAVTYRGPGTIVVSSDYAEDALQDQEDYAGPIFEIPRFWAALFSGERHDRAGLVHRSPRIAGTGNTRVFFCVNAARS